MDFFGIGPGEVLLIIIVALIIVGPGKIAEISKTMGRTLRAIKRAGSELSASVTREIENDAKTPAAKQPEAGNKTAGEKTPPTPEKPATGSGNDEPNKPGGITPAP